MRRRILVISCMVALVIGAAFLALGHGFQGPGMHGKGEGHGDMLEHMSRALNLTDAQKQQAKEIMDSVESTASGIHAKLEEVHKQLATATANGHFDEAQVRTLANQQAQLEADMTVEHFRAISKVFSILTPEQRVKAEELHKQMGSHERHPRMPPSHPGL
jgi:Spy/CpxP family protein refolding chaperone